MKKIIGVLIIIIVLIAAFFWGGTAVKQPTEQPSEPEQTAPVVTTEAEQPAQQEEQPVEQKTETAASESPKPSDKPKDTQKAEQNKQADEPVVAAAATSQPVEQTQAKPATDQLTCTLTVRCETLLANKDKLRQNKAALLPADGVVFATKAVTFYDGESVFNVLQREMKRNKIHMEFNNVPMYNSAYIEGIANLYEFDAGELSGWEYKVNGVFPGYGCSQYKVKNGDTIEWLYTCDLGRDIGAEGVTGNRR